MIVFRIEECLKGANQQTLKRVLTMLEEGRTKSLESEEAEVNGDKTSTTLRQFRRRMPWSGHKLLEYSRRERREAETALEFLNALRKLACEAGFVECHHCNCRDMMLLGRLLSVFGHGSILGHVEKLESPPSAEEVDRICGAIEALQAAATMPPLKRKKQWAAAAVSDPGSTAGKRRRETEVAEMAEEGTQRVTHYDCVSATSVAGTLVINGETLVSKVRRPPSGSPDADCGSPSTFVSPRPLTTSASTAGGPISPAPVESDGNYALKVSPPHGAIEFGADGCEYPNPPLAPPAQRRNVYVRPMASLMAEPPSTAPSSDADAAAPSSAASRVPCAPPLTDLIPAKKGGGKGTRLRELLPAGWPLTVEQTAEMDMQELEHMMAARRLSTENVEKLKQVRRLEKNRRAAKKSRSNTVQAMEKLR